jgi:copper chaperone CopZ
MKKWLTIVLLITSISVSAQIKSATLQASGLTCAMCSNAINKSLKTLSFIERVESDIPNSSFLITFKSGTEINFDQMKKKVEDAGFSVAKLKVVAVFTNENIQNEKAITLEGKQFYFVNVKDQVLNGEQTLTIIDKNFIPLKEYKRFALLTKADSFKTGETKGTRIYHVTI